MGDAHIEDIWAGVWIFHHYPRIQQNKSHVSQSIGMCLMLSASFGNVQRLVSERVPIKWFIPMNMLEHSASFLFARSQSIYFVSHF